METEPMSSIRVTVLGVLLALAAGCGGTKPAVDEAPFREAVVKYLEDSSMDMQPDAFISIDVNGDKATAVVRMATKDEIGYGLKPKWTFSFERVDGKWKASTHRK
jgi:hypothetical protein